MHSRITNIEQELSDLRDDNQILKEDVNDIRRHIDKVPEHFSEKDILRAFIGSLFLGFSTIFSGSLLLVASTMPIEHISTIIFFTLIILIAEIYFIGYSRVEDKKNRRFPQFLIKRLLTFYIVATLVSFILIYIFGLIYLVESTEQLVKIIVIISGPCAIGASIGDLLKKY